MESIYVVYDKDNAMRGIFKELRRAEELMGENAGWYVTELKTDLFGVLDGSW